MLNRELISAAIPALHPNDTVFQALGLMSDFHVGQLPVVADDKYVGLVFESELLNLDEASAVQTAEAHLSKVAVHADRHFYEAVQAANDYHLSIVPVTDKGDEFLGVIESTNLLLQLGKTMGTSEPGGLIILEMDQLNFSFSEISKLVETNDAHITQLNTFWDNNTSTFQVTMKINKFEISDIVATFQRYDYQVKYYYGEETYENELKSNYDHLMNYLGI